MFVQLVHPPQRVSPANLVSSVTIPPLGLAYVASSLEHAGHEVHVVDAIGEGIDHVFQHGSRTLRGLDFEEIIRRIDPRADLIGMGIMFSCAWPALRELVRGIKKRFPDTPLVLGGEHPTAMIDVIFAETPIDFAVLGEGEATFVELCDRLAGGADPGDVTGIALRRGDQVRTNPRRSRIRDIDAIPLPAWQHFDIDRYMRFGQPHGSADGRSMPMLATRGCPFQCTFCSSPGTWGTTWRPRDPKKVVDEIETYIRRYAADDFQFEDLTAIIRKDWVLSFCEEIQRRGLDISWQLPSGTRSEAIDGEVARAMYASGCRQFTYAIESGSPVILERIKKHIRLPRVFASAKEAISAGIRVQAAFIYGFPNETWRQMAVTYATILRCAVAGFHEITICALQPLPNTEMMREMSAAQGGDGPLIPLSLPSSDVPREPMRAPSGRPTGRIEINDDYLDSIFCYLGIWQQKSWNRRVSDLALRLVILMSFASFFSVSFALRPKRAWNLASGLFSSHSQGKLARILKGMLRSAWPAKIRQVPAG